MADGWAEQIEQTEVPLLWLAGGAVGLYLLDLAGLWAAYEAELVYDVVALCIDLVFVTDLVVKLAVLRRSYVQTPWFLVDLLCALPVLSTAWSALQALQGLRFVRVFRMLRALRLLRVLQAIRVLRVVRVAGDTPEQQRYRRVLGLSVVGYASLFVGLVAIGGDDPEKELWLVLGSLLGMGLMLVVTRFQIPALWSQQVRQLLNVALPGPVAEHFMQHPEAYDVSVRMPATVVFCDIKGFTSAVEKMPLEELKSHLEAALDAVVEAHVAQGLLIDKFIGDAVMSFRGGNLVEGTPEDHAYRVVRGALDGARALAELGDPWFSAIKVGGASASDILIGTFGTSKRLSYTVLGDRVNLAARLEASCNGLGVTNLFCAQTRALVGEADDIAWRWVGAVRVQGKLESVEAFEAYDADDAPSWLGAFHEALDAWADGRIDEATSGFRAVAEAHDDALSAHYLDACEALADGLPEGWTPVLVTRK